jgi:hypothetical protein
MIYVLTEEYNDYDQYGAYFVHAWIGKPTDMQLAEKIGSTYNVDHILRGGGRTRKNENHWYNLKEVNE